MTIPNKKIVLAITALVAVGLFLAQTNLGPIMTTFNDFIGAASSPGNPASGNCRAYFNTGTGLMTYINSGGGSCGASGGGVPLTFVNLYNTYGGTDVCSAIAQGKAAHLADGQNLDATGYSALSSAIQCGVSTYVSGYYGIILLPAGTINIQAPNLFMLQTHSDVYGKGEDATQLLACVSGNANCNGNFFPTGATVPTYAVAEWTDDGKTGNFNSTPTFDTRLFNVSINCGGNAGTIGLTNFVAQENESGPHSVSIHDCGVHGSGYMWGGAQIPVTAQAGINSTSSSTSSACTNCSTTPMSSANVAGDTIPTCGMWGTSSGAPASPSSISDTYNGSAYSLIAGSLAADGNFSMECGYSQSINVGASGNTLTYHFPSATNNYTAIMAAEFANIASLGTIDQVATAVTTTGNPTCPSITPTASKFGVMVFCFIEAESTGATYSAGTSSGCAASACHLVVGNSSQGMEWAFQSTPAAITLNFGSATTRRAIAVSIDFVLGTNNGPGSQNHTVGPLDVYIANGEPSTADSTLISGVTGAIGEAGPKEVRDVTATMNPGFTGTAMTELVRVSGTATTFDNIHLEACAGTNSYGFGLGEDAGFSGITINNLNAGNMASCTALLYLSAAYPSNGLVVTNLNAVGPNFPTDLLVDGINGFTDLSANESKISLYSISINGCRFAGSSSGQCILTTSANLPNTFGSVLYQLLQTDYDAACQYGDCQAGAASQYPVTAGYTTIPPNFTQIVVSSNAVQSSHSHITPTFDPSSLSYFGGFPSACNATVYPPIVIARQPVQTTGIGTFTEYPTVGVTSAAFASNTVTLTMVSTTGFAIGNIVRHAGDTSNTGGPFNSGLNTLGYVTGVTGTTVTYGLTYSGSITAGTGGTLQKVAGFVLGTSSAVSSTSACYGFTIGPN